MKTFDDLVHEPHGFHSDGTMASMFFDNGRGVSVVRASSDFGGFLGGTYGADEGLYELAVLKGTEDDWNLDYTTSITSDVLGYLNESDVTKYMKQVQELESV